MADLVSYSDDSDNFSWGSDDEAKPSLPPVLRNLDTPGPSTLDPNRWANGEAPSTSLVEVFMGMGFPKEIVVKGITEIGHSDENRLLELLLTYKALGDEAAVGNCCASGSAPTTVEDDDDLDFENWDNNDDAGGREPNSDSSDDEDFLQELSVKDKKINLLLEMGFPEDETNVAITRCGANADLSVLLDSVSASQYARDYNSRNFSGHEVMDRFLGSVGEGRKARLMDERKKKRKRYGVGAQANRPPLDGSLGQAMPLPKPMAGFNLPGDMRTLIRVLPEQATGRPFFFFENVALAPKGVWQTISRNLYDIQPEFVDSKYLCATARKRGYIHNLPIDNRSPIHPIPPKTIFEAFPHYKKWWPSWDQRRQLNCLLTCVGTATLTRRIQCVLARSDNPPATDVQKYVMKECKKWNLIWVGKNKVASLEPDEYEYLLGFPKDHTRGVGRTERYKALGNSFQVDTVAYHLSVLRNMFPNGVTVLSLFSGIGGGEVALHRLGIQMKTVVSVEISEVNRRILRGWWDQTQTGTLIEIADVKSLSNDRIASLVSRFGGFDLVIGGSPCNNLTGSNRHHRVGLDGDHSSLAYHYFRILGAVKSSMASL
ncbi:DNA (cytosine-5)-methyltransferase DRM2-like isoform X2 [Lolium rigidum]|uniref:DNA (cytosine-5)-methyltransferase DRM2-like isoform X2 n=1 Tax=Lolium rigidum TaxID=89674 RepID=UPI001F5D5093|nr:DNA (cytosine-5)-methyltransferase DRM2-like isoform X2 [Lolium rigidum]